MDTDDAFPCPCMPVKENKKEARICMAFSSALQMDRSLDKTSCYVVTSYTETQAVNSELIGCHDTAMIALSFSMAQGIKTLARSLVQ